jgi:hypothetical protein
VSGVGCGVWGVGFRVVTGHEAQCAGKHGPPTSMPVECWSVAYIAHMRQSRHIQDSQRTNKTVRAYIRPETWHA